MSTNAAKAPRYLTKSRYRLAYECPTKLYFTGKKEYGNAKDDDTFMQSLAHGGFQVGELAKAYFPGGIEVTALGTEEALAVTSEHLKKDIVTLFEAAIRYENFFIRADILEKRGRQINLYEVKAKSYDPSETDFFLKDRSALSAKWEKYIADVAFQAFVLQKAFPNFTIHSHLFLANKTARATIDGLNQNLLLVETEGGRRKIKVKKPLTPDDFGRDLLVPKNVDPEVQYFLNGPVLGGNFDAKVAYFAESYQKDIRIEPALTSTCKKCEFRLKPEKKEEGLKSGFEECWETKLGGAPKGALVIDLWNYRGVDKSLQERKYYLKDLGPTEIGKEKAKDKAGLSYKDRQKLQIQQERNHDVRPYWDLRGLTQELRSWKFPLHFIDFETTMVALPFHKGRRPYEQIAFQFSHHKMEANGKVAHVGQYINEARGTFPNFEFIRRLKMELEKDEGTVLRYADHENTVLRQIHEQLSESDLPKEEIESLQKFIDSLTSRKENPDDKERIAGKRNMVDMCALVKSYYYHPLTKGSNSLKYVLPATLQFSTKLQEKYGKANYGSEGGIPSLNYKNHQWIKQGADGKVEDPYRQLPPILTPEQEAEIERFSEGSEITNGGSAMMAYARTQFVEMSELEAKKIFEALLKYCELDTLAMVMLYEFFKELVEGQVPCQVALSFS